MNHPALQRLRRTDVASKLGTRNQPSHEELLEQWEKTGIKFVASPKLEDAYYSALKKLFDCIVPTYSQGPILHEGGVYHGSWLESTGTINAELLSRFIPMVSQQTYQAFAKLQREDGLIPYKLTAKGPVFKQIQLVSPLARSVWNHFRWNGHNREFLRRMYDAMRRYDQWLVTYRNTRGTGCVDAFCTYDTGHDLSPRFWHVPDVPYRNSPTDYSPDSPILPFLAPDLTANVYCQRNYLARIAEELGETGDEWRAKADESKSALFRYCFDTQDEFFYDLDNNGEFVRVQSDVLLRVLACEVGDDAFFERALRRYLLNTSKFFAKYPFTSISMGDPRFDPSSSYNTWGGTSNFLSLIRAPHAFEHHHRYVELTWVIQPILNALSRMTRFGQTINPWTGEEGYTESYSPAILCMLDFVERLAGILPTPNGELWFTGLMPEAFQASDAISEETAYRRMVDDVEFELVNSRNGCVVYQAGRPRISFPYGLRVVTRRDGTLIGAVGMSARRIEGTVSVDERMVPVSVEGNERLEFRHGGFHSVANPGVVWPTYR